MAELGHVLLAAGHFMTALPEDLEEVVMEALRLALLTGRVLPVFSKDRRAGVVPRQMHQLTTLALTRPAVLA